MQNIRLFEKETYYKSALTEICKSGGGGTPNVSLAEDGKIHFETHSYLEINGVKWATELLDGGKLQKCIYYTTTNEDGDEVKNIVDLATLKWGSNWRMPTQAEMLSLKNTSNILNPYHIYYKEPMAANDWCNGIKHVCYTLSEKCYVRPVYVGGSNNSDETTE